MVLHAFSTVRVGGWLTIGCLGFYINLPVGGVVGILLLLFRIPEPESKPPAREVLGTAIKSLDLPGFMLISPAAVMFLLGLQYGGNQFAWDSSVVIGLLVGAAAMFVLFLFWERRQGDEAMVPFAMLKHRIIWYVGFLFLLPLYGSPWLPVAPGDSLDNTPASVLLLIPRSRTT